MTKRWLAILATQFVCVIVAGSINLAQKAQTPQSLKTAAPAARTAPSPIMMTRGVQTEAAMSPASQSALVNKYCYGCHDDDTASGGLDITKLDFAHVDQHAEIAEKVIHKLRASLMPPAGMPRPERTAVKAFVASLENAVDKAAALHPSPGSRPFQRLTRTEYASSIRDLLAIDVDVTGLLPPDSLSDGFDNIADSQSFSPALMEGYMRAASKITREALGDPKADPTSAIFKVPRTGSQLRHVEGAPLGTRGGIAMTHNFAADGEYVFKILMHGSPTGQLFGRTYPGEQLEISIDGERMALIDIPPNLSESSPNGLTLETPKVTVKAGPHQVAAAFLQRTSLLVDDIIAPIEHTLADSQIGTAREISTLPHLRELQINGPFKVTGVSDTPSRRKVFMCRPISASEEMPCATKIVTALARQAYRRPVNTEDLEGLMSFYDAGRKDVGDFEAGIRTALQAILASPNFVFRFEQTPANVKPGQTYRISDLELASRLSYFLWTTAPDYELINVASQGRLRDPAVLEKQVRRMIAGPRSESLATKFAAQWLRLPDLMNIRPDALAYPQYDNTLAESMKRETELFFDSIVRDDRSVLDLLTANHTFVDERLAKHYGMPNIMGSRFRRVDWNDDNRRGLIGKGAILTLTSVADRTSPVMRGKWVMEVLLGTPPPPPPPNVPDFGETKAVADGKALSVRERMEMHRANPACASCHKMIDPIGLSLENFDVTGVWRLRDHGVLIDPTSELYDGAKLNGPVSLRQALLNLSDAVIGNLTEKLMTYALGRRLEYYDMPMVRTITRDAARNNNRFSSFILGIVKSPAFQMSTAETTMQN